MLTHPYLGKRMCPLFKEPNRNQRITVPPVYDCSLITNMLHNQSKKRKLEEGENVKFTENSSLSYTDVINREEGEYRNVDFCMLYNIRVYFSFFFR